MEIGMISLKSRFKVAEIIPEIGAVAGGAVHYPQLPFNRVAVNNACVADIIQVDNIYVLLEVLNYIQRGAGAVTQ